jgi:2'-5' RNA ligase
VAGDERIRLFCALQLPDDSLDAVVAWQTRVLRGEGRVVPRENLHVTLAFLGACSVDAVEGVARELRAASAAAPPLELRPLRYRETRNVGMIVLDDPSGAATALAEDVQERLERLGVYRPDARRWLPHLTVLRFRKPEGVAPAVANMCSIHVVRSALYRSQLGRDGARYEVLETAALGGS